MVQGICKVYLVIPNIKLWNINLNWKWLSCAQMPSIPAFLWALKNGQHFHWQNLWRGTSSGRSKWRHLKAGMWHRSLWPEEPWAWSLVQDISLLPSIPLSLHRALSSLPSSYYIPNRPVWPQAFFQFASRWYFINCLFFFAPGFQEWISAPNNISWDFSY